MPLGIPSAVVWINRTPGIAVKFIIACSGPTGAGERKAQHMSTRIFRQLALAAVIVATPLALAQDVTVTHAQGQTTLRLNPELVFSFDYAAIDTLTTLGVTVDGAPQLAGAAPS